MSTPKGPSPEPLARRLSIGLISAIALVAVCLTSISYSYFHHHAQREISQTAEQMYRQANLHFLLGSTLSLVLVLVVVVIGVNLMLRRHLAQPLQQVVARIRMIGSGDYDGADTVDGSREISTIINELNQMAENMQRREATLNAMNESLESQLNERKRSEHFKEMRLRLIDCASSLSSLDLLTRFLDETAELSGSLVGAFHCLDPDSGVSAMQILSTEAERRMAQDYGPDCDYPSLASGAREKVISTRKDVICNDDTEVGCLQREIAAPVIRGDKIVAVVSMANKETDYTRRDLDEVRTLADLAWEMISAKRIEDEQKRFVSAIEQAAEAIVITDATGTINYVNPSFENITGYTRDQAIGRNPRMLKSSVHDAAFYRAMWDKLSRGETWSGRMVNKGKDGSLFTEEAVISPVRDDNGRVVSYIAVKHDVSKEIELEMQLRQAEKMEAVGHLAGGVAHEFNNIIGGIMGYADMNLDDAPEEGYTRHNLQQILKAAERAKHLVKQVLSFSRQGTGELEPVYLKPLIKEVTQTLGSSLPDSIDIATDLKNESTPVLADVNAIRDVLANLVNNASEAMSGKGVVRMRLSELTIIDSIPGMNGPIRSGDYAIIDVEDDGCGIGSEMLEHVFEPFYTTKGITGGGAGMGLAVVFGIVQSHTGNLLIDSEPGRGTAVKIFLPKAQVPDKRDVDKVVGGTERILFVDDEQDMVELTELVLSQLGYSVTALNNAGEACAQFSADPQAFDLVITDQGMPGLTGLELAESLIRIRNDIPIVLCTGYSGLEDENVEHSNAIRAFCMKPVGKKELARTIREVLDT